MYLILGYGRSGQATEKYLKALGRAYVIYDESKNLTPPIDWPKISHAIQSPGIAPNHPISAMATKLGVRIGTDIDLLQERSPNANYIGITGTNGKSTITALVGHILREAGFKTAVGGNIGVPVLDLPHLEKGEWYALELSSYQLELANELNLNAAVWSNLTPDHLERHETMENYLSAKRRIFTNAKSAVIGVDDDFSLNVAKDLRIPHKTVAVSRQAKRADFRVDGNGVLSLNDKTFDLNAAPNLKGEHNRQNIALAFLAALPIVKDPEFILKSVESFPGLEHRQKLTAIIGNVSFVNDSKATNAAATEKALKTFRDRKIFWIVGGVAKTDGIDSLAPYFADIEKAYLIGEASERFALSLRGKVAFTECHTVEKAVREAFADAKNGENSVVLFSPACASFDQFADFERRGTEFIERVKALESGR